MLDDPDVDFGDILAAAIEHAPDHKQEEIHEALRELTEDQRGPRSWAADRLERRQLGQDIRLRDGRRFGRDEPEPFPGRPRPGGGMDPISGEDRRLAGDMAFDSSPRAEFARWFPYAARIERF
jgi:hypothetical protein